MPLLDRLPSRGCPASHNPDEQRYRDCLVQRSGEHGPDSYASPGGGLASTPLFTSPKIKPLLAGASYNLPGRPPRRLCSTVQGFWFDLGGSGMNAEMASVTATVAIDKTNQASVTDNVPLCGDFPLDATRNELCEFDRLRSPARRGSAGGTPFLPYFDNSDPGRGRCACCGLVFTPDLPIGRFWTVGSTRPVLWARRVITLAWSALKSCTGRTGYHGCPRILVKNAGA